MKLNRTNILPIGVDVGTTSVKLAQLRPVEDTYELLAAASAPIPREWHEDGGQYARRLPGLIRELVATEGFKGRQCAVSIPAKDTFLRHVRLPNLKPDEISQALADEFRGKLPYPVENAVIRHVVAGEIYDDGENKQEIIVVASHRKVTESYIQMAKRAKLDVVALNIEPCAIVECFARLFNRASDGGRTTLYIDLGAASTQVVMAHGSRIVFAHNLKRGSRQLDQALARKLDLPIEKAADIRMKLAADSVDPETRRETGLSQKQLQGYLREELDVLTEELTQCLRYYESVFRNRNIERAIFVGGQARDRRLCQAIAQRLNLPAQVGDPLLRFRCSAGAGAKMGLKSTEPYPGLAVAVGLCLGAGQAA